MTLKIFTDGSYLLHTKENRAGYAFIILDGDREYVKYGKLRVKCCGSTCAETYAILQSLHYAVGKFNNISKIVIRGDCTAAMELVQGSTNHCKSGKFKQLRTDVQSTRKMIMDKGIKLQTRAVKAHSVIGQGKDGAYNQCVDSLAKLGANL